MPTQSCLRHSHTRRTGPPYKAGSHKRLTSIEGSDKETRASKGERGLLFTLMDLYNSRKLWSLIESI